MKHNQIIDFLNNLKKGEVFFKKKIYDFQKYNCEMSSLCKDMHDGNINALIDFWKRKDNNIFFELKHPIYNHIITRAVFSKDGCIFFVDKDNRYPWIGFQGGHIFNYFIVEDSIFEVCSTHYKINFKLFYELILEDCVFKDAEFGFALSSSMSMWHSFYEELSYLYKIQPKRPIQDNQSVLFLPKKFKNVIKDMVWFLPKGIPAGQVAYHGKVKIFKTLGQEIFKESINEVYVEKDKKYDLTLWLSLVYRNFTNKTWLQQIEGSISILRELSKYFKTIKVFVDGLKSFENGKGGDGFFVEEIISKLRKELSNKIEIVSLNNMTVRQAVCYCNTVDISICEACSGAIIPVLCCNKPSILYGNTNYITSGLAACSNFKDDSRLINPSFIDIDRNQKLNGWEGFYNYHIPWQHIYNLMAEVLEELSATGKLRIKKLKIYRLDVPPVELVAKQYELEQKLNIKFSIENVALFNEIEKKINILMLNNTTIINNINNAILPIQNKAYNLGQNIQKPNCQFLSNSAKSRIHNHLSYKLGQALIENSKSILGYIRIPFVLSYIKDKHKFEQKAYEEKIKDNPNLALPPLETYPDYNEALKEKECFTYKLGEALIQANKNWYKGGYIKFYFKDVPRLKREFGKR
ncbi:alpha-2,3-sialyltransferase [Campylobacter jejuni]|nr:alpha-2,3-sialyltransferase [Campylobacter jejuni]